MLKNYFSLIFLFIFLSNINAQKTYVPDDNFEQALIDLGYDDVLDDYVVTSNISGVTNLKINGRSIRSVIGIEDFINLTELHCEVNHISSLDVSKNTALETLYCQINDISSLDVSKNTALETLYCSSNLFSSLDVSKNTLLTGLQCGNNNLSSLELSNNTLLSFLSCSETNVNSFDLTQNIALSTLVCADNNISSLDVSKNTLLTYLDCADNNISSLDVSKNTLLTYLDCARNKLTSLDVTPHALLNYLNCSFNNLTSIDATQNTALGTLSCVYNQITSLDVSKNTSLNYLLCFNNNISSLDVSKNISLKMLLCYDNQLASLDVKSGNNSILSQFDATINSQLQCIQIDNETDANNGVAPYDTWQKDASATYSEDCQAFLGVDDEILSEGLNLYPNPVSNFLIVDSKLQLEKVEIYSILGQKVKEVNSDFNSISTVNLSRGIYMIRIYSEKGTVVRKLIKK